MSKYPSDSFLPSGALDSPRKYLGRTDSMISPRSVPRSVPDYIPSPHNSDDGSPSMQTHGSSPSQVHPMSPPKTRSTSAENSSAALIEDWRLYAQRLRSQAEGERAHMHADRARMEEVMAEERALWDKERDMLKARIAELEGELLKKGGQAPAPYPMQRQPYIGVVSPGSRTASATGSIDSVHSRIVPQESGRNADGSPFYAPAPRNPSRTFDTSENTDLRVDDVHAPQETAICVTSKELTSSDFIQSPPTTHDLEPIQEAAETIDISHIHSGLEGVSIKVSAVDPTFAAKILSPRRSPSKLSPDTNPPPRDVTNMTRSLSQEDKQKITLEVVVQPENRRLTMHAGHTPNHSISKFSFLNHDGESGNATPTQAKHNDHNHSEPHPPHIDHEESFEAESQHSESEYDYSDRELSGPLSLPTEAVVDDLFLTQLTEKLNQEVIKSSGNSAINSPESEDGRTKLSPRERDEEEKDDGPVLKIKSSMNFGRPLGSM